MARERQQHERKVERLRLQRLGEDLTREAAARRARRKSKEDELVRSMFSEAFDVERERLLAAKAKMALEQYQQDKELLGRYETAKKSAQDRLEMLQEELAKDKERKKAMRKHAKETLGRLNKELEEDLTTRLQRLRVELDSQEEE